jgi:hypothetical protein
MSDLIITVPTEHCLENRLTSQVIVSSEVGSWKPERKIVQTKIDRHFTIPDSWKKLKKLHPIGEEYS